jgi:hypothetical protein
MWQRMCPRRSLLLLPTTLNGSLGRTHRCKAINLR